MIYFLAEVRTDHTFADAVIADKELPVE